MAEKLLECEDIQIGKETLRKILIEARLWKNKTHKKKTIHQRRERRACRGELVQIDGSPHAWFEDRAPACCLIVFIDDATSQILYAHFEPVETTEAYFRGIQSHLKHHGIPLAYYSDRHMIFRVSNAQSDEVNKTQFERACEELGITGICAHSPQAKGRVERTNRTLQDRLVKELRLAGISTLEAGNAFLTAYLPLHNKKFATAPRDAQDLHDKNIPPDHILSLILSIQSERKLSKNLELSFNAKIYQIQNQGKGRRLQQSTVTICEMLNGQIQLLSAHSSFLDYTMVSCRTKASALDAKEINPHLDKLKTTKKIIKPADNHPWKKYPSVSPKPTKTNPSLLPPKKGT